MTDTEKTRKTERLIAKLLPFAVAVPAFMAWLTKRNHHPQHFVYVYIAVGYAIVVAIYAIRLNLKWRKANKISSMATNSAPMEKARNG